MTVQETADTYLKHYHSKSPDDFWAWNAVEEMCRKQETGVAICVALAASCQTAAELAYIAAGPYEELIERYGPDVLLPLKMAAQTSEKVRVALSGIWIRKDHPAYEGWKLLMIDYGYWDKRPMSPVDRGWNPKEAK